MSVLYTVVFMQKFIYFDTMNQFIILNSIGKNQVSAMWSINNMNMSRYRKNIFFDYFLPKSWVNPHVFLEILAKK